jgi:hypothetical protein
LANGSILLDEEAAVIVVLDMIPTFEVERVIDSEISTWDKREETEREEDPKELEVSDCELELLLDEVLIEVGIVTVVIIVIVV